MATEDDIAATLNELKAKELVRVRRVYTIAELDSLPEMSWQIEEHFPSNSFVVMYGASGSGKSFAALDMALSVATGVPLTRSPRPSIDGFNIASRRGKNLPNAQRKRAEVIPKNWLKTGLGKTPPKNNPVVGDFSATLLKSGIRSTTIRAINMGCLAPFTVNYEAAFRLNRVCHRGQIRIKREGWPRV